MHRPARALMLAASLMVATLPPPVGRRAMTEERRQANSRAATAPRAKGQHCLSLRRRKP